MKIEKINENQIRCTLTREDLASRQLKISELAYGTEKAKSLFREMMRQANFEFGFEAEDIPLMIEAVPLNSECIVLIITKVDDPEELDTRFARFAPDVAEEREEIDPDDLMAPMEELSPEDEIFDLFRRMQTAESDTHTSGKDTGKSTAEPLPTQEESTDRSRLFMFANLSRTMELASVLAGRYDGESILYKDSRSNTYLLLLNQNGGSREAFDRACNIASEYGARRRLTTAISAFLSEHCETLIASGAISALGQN